MGTVFKSVACLVATLVITTMTVARAADTPSIRIGLLHSLTGPMAPNEKPIRNAALMAIDEINDDGGIDGALLEPVVADGKSDNAVFRAEAERLIDEEKVTLVVGCWTSSCRKAILPVMERKKRLLIYPLQYEGMESSPFVFYTGALPNQQILPALWWGIDQFGGKAFLVGSDYIYPRTANLIIRQALTLKGGSVAGERYLPFDSAAVAPLVAEIAATQPDVIYNNINGATNGPFFDALKADPATASIPVISFSLSEAETMLHPKRYLGAFLAWGYFERIDSRRNRSFVEAYQRRYGEKAPISDPVEAAYIGLHLWANAAREAGSTELGELRRDLAHQSYDAPQGIVSVSLLNQHLWRTARIGQVTGNGRATVIWSSVVPLRPIPFPRFRTPSEWKRLLEKEGIAP